MKTKIFKPGDIGVVNRTGQTARVLEICPNQYGHTRLIIEVWNDTHTRRDRLTINSGNLRSLADVRYEAKLFKGVSMRPRAKK